MTKYHSTSRGARGPGHWRGFTLVELMVTVVVISILTAIAVPSYVSHVRQSRRTEAKTALLDLAGREERYYNTNNNVYTNSAANLGYAPTGSAATVTNMSVINGYYQVTVTVNPAGIPAPSYLIVATPLTADQAKDVQCAQFSIDSTGLQAATNASCWQ
jgi:type IV pilus assembly protein PilE